MNLTLEDCLEALDTINWNPVVLSGDLPVSITNTRHRAFINDVADQVRHGSPLTTAQGEHLHRLVTQYRAYLVAYGHDGYHVDALSATDPNSYRTPPKVTPVVRREVRYVGNNILAFRSPYHRGLVDDTKQLRATTPFTGNHFSYPRFHRKHNLWLVLVNQHNLNNVQKLISKYGFDFDDAVVEFLMEATNSIGASSTVTVEAGSIVVNCRNDNFLDNWLTHILQVGM